MRSGVSSCILVCLAVQKEVFEAVTARPYNIILYSFCGPESLKFFPALNITYLCKVVLYTILPYVKFLSIIIVVPLLYSTDQLQLKFKVIRNALLSVLHYSVIV